MNNSYPQDDDNLAIQRLSSSVASISDVAATCSINNNSNAKIPKERSLTKGMLPLPLCFEPSNHSIHCGRGKASYNAVGNRRLRVLVSTFLQQYIDAQHNPHEKTRIIEQVVAMVKDACPVGAFIKYDNGRYYELSDKGARDKCGALFRDCLQANKKEEQAKQAKQLKQQQREQRRSSLQYAPFSIPPQMQRHSSLPGRVGSSQAESQHVPPPTPETFQLDPIGSLDVPFPTPLPPQSLRASSLASQDCSSSGGSFFDVDTKRSVSMADDPAWPLDVDDNVWISC